MLKDYVMTNVVMTNALGRMAMSMDSLALLVEEERRLAMTIQSLDNSFVRLDVFETL